MKIRSRLLTKLGARLVVGFCRLLFRTARIRVHCIQPEANAYENNGPERYFYCLWHDQTAFPLFCGRSNKFAALVSRHRDGSFLAESMRLLDVKTIRGSSSRGGTQAVRQMMDAAADWHIAITPDGPRGPRRRLKNGILYLASRTGRPVVPLVFACARCWRIRGSWTDMVFPAPFTRIQVLAGEPIEVPAGLSREELDGYAGRLQRAMEDYEYEAHRLLEGRPAPPSAQEPKAAA